MGKLAEILSHPDEIIPLIHVYRASQKAKQLPNNEGLAFCYGMLNKVSRSFAVVIQQLETELRDAVCIFYLVLRALDTVEDDMSLSNEQKLPILVRFHDIIYEHGWHMTCGDGHYVELMERFPLVSDCFLRLKKPYREVIADITKRMGRGMAEFIVKDVETKKDYDLYCHYVAGLVGYGLSGLFASSGLEDEEFGKRSMDGLSNSMGLFLQKTNIIRDYLEDIVEEPAPRMFWPKEIWGKHGKKLADFKDPENREVAVACLNEMITDALQLAPQSLEYMSRLQEESVFRFCAIPQVMAIATLAKCYDNGMVFEGVVKIRRGLSAKMITHTVEFKDVVQIFRHFAAEIGSRVKPGKDPSAKATLKIVEEIEADCDRRDDAIRSRNPFLAQDQNIPVAAKVGILGMACAYAAYAFQVDSIRGMYGVDPRGASPFLDQVQQGLAVLILVFSLAIALKGRRF